MALFGKKQKALLSVEQTRKTLHQNLEFTAIEQYKILRTNLPFTLPREEACPVVGVTSAVRSEGKSTTAVNLSYVFAESGKRVLLIDGDLRIPSVAQKMELPGEFGLTDHLMGAELDIEAYHSGLLENWYIMPAGKLPPNPSELLGSKQMQELLERLKGEFDYIFLDLPPVNIVSDAVAVAKYLTGVVVVICENYTEKPELERCLRQLELAEVRVLGCVMNQTKTAGSKYKKGKYYYREYRQKN